MVFSGGFGFGGVGVRVLPVPARRRLLGVAGMIVAVLLFMAPLASGAVERPEAAVEDSTAVVAVPSTEAALHGAVNPGGGGEAGTYEFLYKASKAGACEGGSVTAEGLVLSGEREEPSEAISGLAPGTEYAVCLRVQNDARTESATSIPVSFLTPTPPQVPETTAAAKSVTASSAVVEGTLNPAKEVEAGWYFLYSTESTCANGGTATPAVAPAKVKAKTKEHVTISELQPHRTYAFCLVATNSAGEAVQSAGEGILQTLAVAPRIESESAVVPVPAHEATVEATINPNNEATSYKLEYSTGASGETLKAPITTVEGVSPVEGYPGQGVSITTGEALVQNKTYYYRLIAENEQSKKEGKPVAGKVQHFTTGLETPEGEEANPVGTATATLRGVLSPNATATGGTGTYEFRYRQSGSECEHGEHSEDKTAPVPAGTSAGAPQEAVQANVTGLSPGTQYTFCLVEHAPGVETTTGAPSTFTTQGPGILNERASAIESGSATLQASINPNGSNTTYHFEYDTTPYTSGAEHGTSITSEGKNTEVALGAGTTPEHVEARLTGLQPHTTYYYRVVAIDEIEAFYGPNKAFTTIPAGSEPAQGCKNEKLREEQPYGLSLPDCRAYELVSPTNTNGQDATSLGAESVARASEAPDGTEPAITYTAKGSFGAPQGSLVENQYLSRRTSEGWQTEAITPLSSTGATGATEGHEDSYPGTYFTPELTAGLAVTSAELGGAPELNANLGIYLATFPGSTYQYIFQTAGAGANIGAPWGASTDLRRVVLTNPENGTLFEWVNGTDEPVSVTNAGEALPASTGGVQYFLKEKDAWHATSEDGSRVLFTTPPELGNGVGQLYVRVNVGQPQSTVGGKGECLEPTDACTVEVSASKREPEDPAGPQPARYWGASVDGGKVFFTSNAELTQNAYTGPDDNGANLYEYDLETGTLKDLSVDSEDVAEGAAVQGVVQIANDGSYVYFVATGKLASGAVEGEPNLYVSHDGGAPVFVAILTAERDKTDWANGNSTESGPEINTAVVGPSGAELAFISERSLTGYDNRQDQPGECETTLESHENETGLCREVYLYDAEAGSLVCASCNPTGARPVGPSSIPGVVPTAEDFADYRPRDLLADGVLFFESEDALLPRGSDGRNNVYEYEAGVVHALSNTTGGYESFFLDASPDGENVFFASADRLLTEDPGGNTVVWDARVDGGVPVVASSAPCTNGEACQSPPTPPPVIGAPASATFSGPGNVVTPVVPVVKPKPLTRAQKLAKALKACRKDRAKKKRVTCEKTARKRYGPKKQARQATNATSDRRAGR